MPPDGQHEAGKHSKKGQKKQAEQPRMPKGKKGQAANTTTSGHVYKKKGAIRRFLGF